MFVALFGVLTGIVAAFFGIGGGVLIVPFLILCVGLDERLAAGTSMLAVLITSVSSTIAYERQRRVVNKLALLLACASIPGGLLGALVTSVAPRLYFKVILSSVLVLAAVKMIRKRRSGSSGVPRGLRMRRIPLALLCTFLGATIASSVGIGGGVINVPVMTLVLGLPIHYAVATSCFVIVMTSSASVAGHVILGHTLVDLGLLLGCGTALGAQVGARLARRTPPRILRLAFACLLVVVAVRILLR